MPVRKSDFDHLSMPDQEAAFSTAKYMEKRDAKFRASVRKAARQAEEMGVRTFYDLRTMIEVGRIPADRIRKTCYLGD